MKPFACSPQSRAALDAAIVRGLAIFTPKPPLSLSQWSDEFAYIPAGSAEPGKFVTAVAEYQREPMDAISDPRLRKIVLIWASQTGKSQIQINSVGYFSHHDAAYMLMIQPTVERAEEFSKLRIASTIRDTPVLREIFPDPKSRDSGNTVLLKEFAGGYLALIGANAPSGLASKPVRILFPDEVDRFPESAGTEGDALDLAYIRGSTYWNFKAVETSTPLIKGASRIEQSFADSDKRFYMVRCPHCGLEQRLEWKNLRWESEDSADGKPRPTRVWYECASGSRTQVGVSSLGCAIEESSKYEMIRRGRWQATAQSLDGRTAGFHLNALYSPWVEWTGLVYEWLAAQSDAEKLQVFVNTRMAESWELRGDGAEESILSQRQEQAPHDNTLPAGVLLLTLGTDVQRDRIEATVWGWGLDKEAWIIEHRVFRGSPALPEEDPNSPWRELDDYRRSVFPHPSGKSLPISCVAVDSGDQTKIVYDYTRRRERQRVYAVKGVSGFGRSLVNNGTRPDKNKTLLYIVGVDTAKEAIYSSLKLEKPGPGYTHILKTNTLDANYLLQLTAEHLITTRRKGRPILSYQLREGRRNEALDCAVYARAAREILRPNFAAIYKNIFGTQPPPRAAVQPAPSIPPAAILTDEQGEKSKDLHLSSSAPEYDPFSDLPKVGTQNKGSDAYAAQNWRNSWKIL